MLTLNKLIEDNAVSPARSNAGLLFRLKNKFHIVDEDGTPVKGFLITRRLNTDQKYTLSLVYDEDNTESLSDLLSLGLWDTNPVALNLNTLGIRITEADDYIPYFPDGPVDEEIEITGTSFLAQLV